MAEIGVMKMAKSWLSQLADGVAAVSSDMPPHRQAGFTLQREITIDAKPAIGVPVHSCKSRELNNFWFLQLNGLSISCHTKKTNIGSLLWR